MWLLADYASRPGAVGKIPQTRPHSTQLESSKATQILLFYHPHCPCTSSTVANLTQLRQELKKPFRLVAFAYCPTKEADSWIESEITDSLRQIPNIVIRIDRGGSSAQSFEIVTSGHCLVYNETGHLIFSGGLTPLRGHQGQSRSGEYFVESVNSRVEKTNLNWPVFGCKILGGIEP